MTLLELDVAHLATQLPQSKRKLDAVVTHLLQGKSVLWTFPRTFSPRQFMATIWDNCVQAGLDVTEVVASTGADPITALRDALNLEQIQASSDPLSECWERAPDVLILQGLEEVSEDEARAWARVVARWCDNAKRQDFSQGSPKRILAPTSNMRFTEMAGEDPFIVKEWFWAYLTNDDLRILARELCLNRGLSPIDQRWVSASVVEVAGCDPDAMAWLIDRWKELRSASDVTDALLEYAKALRWTEDLADGTPFRLELERRWISSVSQDGSLLHPGNSNADSVVGASPPAHGRSLWWNGMLNGDPAIGIQVHSAVFAALGRIASLEHRIWVGQARMLLPILAAARMDLCRYLSRRFPDWSAYCRRGTPSNGAAQPPESEVQLAEWPDICAFLNEAARRYARMRELRDVAHKLRTARNDLAHYTPLSRDAFDALWRELRIARNIVSDV